MQGTGWKEKAIVYQTGKKRKGAGVLCWQTFAHVSCVPKEMEPQRHGDHPGKVVKAMEGDTPTPFTMGEVARGVWRKLRGFQV